MPAFDDVNLSTDEDLCLAKLSLLCQNHTMTGGDDNVTLPGGPPDLSGKDASWILTSAVIIFTMQTGFGLLEAGCVSPKSETNIMMKNALDVVFGGVTYWAVGFGFSFGQDAGTNPFIGVGNFFVTVADESVGYIYALFLFQLSFATTATTIVSGAMAERTKLIAYNCFSSLMTFIYCIPAHWVWSEDGFLYKWGAIDIAGCGPVHLVGGTTGLVASLLIGPRAGAFDGERGPLPSPLKAILGMFMLWWGWLRFNSGSVFIVSSSSEWKRAVRAAVNTIVSSMGGGITSVLLSLLYSRVTQKMLKYDIGIIVNGVLGSLVSITAICTLSAPWESFIIGSMGALLAFIADYGVYKLKIDDPVGVIPVHMVCGIWGLLAVGLFVPEGGSLVKGQAGLFKSGQFYLLGIQALTVVLIAVWTLILAVIFLKVIDLTIGLRLSKEEELIGADTVEHGIPALSFPITTTTAAESMETVTADEESQNNCEDFKSRTTDLFKDMIKSCTRNDLQMVLKNPSADCITIELRLRDKTPSVDSGVEIHI